MCGSWGTLEIRDLLCHYFVPFFAYWAAILWLAQILNPGAMMKQASRTLKSELCPPLVYTKTLLNTVTLESRIFVVVGFTYIYVLLVPGGLSVIKVWTKR